MSKIIFPCPQCGQSLGCDENNQGKQLKCPKCQHLIQLEGISKSTPQHSTIAGSLSAFAVIAVLGFFMCWGIYALCIHFPDKPQPSTSQQRLSQSPAASPASPQTIKSELQVTKLKLYQSSTSHTSIDIQIYNNSDEFLSYYKIDAAVYSQSGQYLGRSFENGSNLRPKQAVTGTIIFNDIQANEVGDWKPEIERLKNKDGEDVAANFQLAIMQTPQSENSASSEHADFYNANFLFNQRDYKNAAAAYDSFAKNYPSSPRIPIVRQRTADILRIINAQNKAIENGIAGEFAKQRALQLSSPYLARDGSGVFNYPGTVIVKGYGKTKSAASKSAYKKIPQSAYKPLPQGESPDVYSTEYYPIDVENFCCEISYKP